MPVTSGIKQSHPIGLSNLHIAVITKDDSTGVTFGDTFSFPEIVSISIEPQSSDATLYGDNGAVDTANTTSVYNLSVEMAQVPLEYRAILLGHEFAAGKIIAKADDVAPFVAIAFETLKSNGSKRYFKFLKVKFQEPNETSNTKGENVEFSTATLEAKAIYRAYDNAVYNYADEEESFADAATWYTFSNLP